MHPSGWRWEVQSILLGELLIYTILGCIAVAVFVLSFLPDRTDQKRLDRIEAATEVVECLHKTYGMLPETINPAMRCGVGGKGKRAAAAAFGGYQKLGAYRYRLCMKFRDPDNLPAPYSEGRALSEPGYRCFDFTVSEHA